MNETSIAFSHNLDPIRPYVASTIQCQVTEWSGRTSSLAAECSSATADLGVWARARRQCTAYLSFIFREAANSCFCIRQTHSTDPNLAVEEDGSGHR